MKRKTFQPLKEIVVRIGEKFRPSRIILFGSLVHGKPHADSDADILIIFDDSRQLSKKYKQISQESEPRPFPIDLLVRSSKQIQDRLEMGDSFIREILSKGKILYES